MAEGHKECWMCRYKLEEEVKPEDKDAKPKEDTAVEKTEDEAKPKEEEAEKAKPKKFNVDEHFNHELHANKENMCNYSNLLLLVCM